ncbi:MAG: GGDEF domain-containing protein [Xanthobacteraceae bacterium]|jgi:diguanylate cyclase (GGDEF)-like protein
MQLSAPTIQIVVLANFLALFVAWSYVVRSYPGLNGARFWQASNLAAAVGAGLSLLRGIVDPLAPILIGNTLLVLACCLCWAGVRQFHGRSIPWRASLVITAAALALLVVFTRLDDDVTVRVAVMSLAEFVAFGLVALELRNKPEPGRSPGADLASLMIIAIMMIQGLRSVSAFAGLGGPISPITFNGAQAFAFLLLIFASMMVNFGFLLMAIDRLRADVAALALVDDLTGIANRRHFLVRLAEACARAAHGNEPLALLIIDLDGFKGINDGFGHGAGDACLRAFTRAAQARLRDSDLFARTGGDEFSVILPATTLNEAALVARDLVKTCRKARAHWNGDSIPMTVSIGVAAWSSEVGLDSQMLITAADQALYAAKKQGRDRLALPEVPEIAEVDALRMTA